MSHNIWDIHDVIGAKPAWFYAKCLEDYMARGGEEPDPLPKDIEYDVIVICDSLVSLIFLLGV